MYISNDYSNSIFDILEKVDSFDIFIDGKKNNIDKLDKKYNNILKGIERSFYNSRIEPAFGVSLHDLTNQELKSGEWIQLNFSSTQTKNDLPFDALLFKLDNCYGLNLIRLFENRYDGRCIYLSLDDKTDLSTILDNTL